MTDVPGALTSRRETGSLKVCGRTCSSLPMHICQHDWDGAGHPRTVTPLRAGATGGGWATDGIYGPFGLCFYSCQDVGEDIADGLPTSILGRATTDRTDNFTFGTTHHATSLIKGKPLRERSRHWTRWLAERCQYTNNAGYTYAGYWNAVRTLTAADSGTRNGQADATKRYFRVRNTNERLAAFTREPPAQTLRPGLFGGLQKFLEGGRKDRSRRR